MSTGRRAPGIVLGGVAALSSLPMVHYGARARVEYDGWWHVFVARQEVWERFWLEVGATTHPPVYFFLLKAVTNFGTDVLVYRSISIVAAVVAAVALGAAMLRVGRTWEAAILGSAAFALSTSTVIIANEVRSYMVATALLLCALWPYLTLVRPAGGARPRVLFAVALTLALLTHYGVLFVFVVLLGAPVALCLVFPDYRRSWRSSLPSRWRADLATLALPVSTFAAAYLVQIRWHRSSTTHVQGFIYDGSEPLWEFLGRNLVAQVDLFAPLDLSDRSVAYQVGGVAAAVALPALTIWLLRRNRAPAIAAVFPVVVLALTAVQILAAWSGRYPFGGGLRHQFFVFPFAVGTLFLFFDQVLIRLPGGLPKRMAAAVLGVVVLAHAHAQWRLLPRPYAPLFQAEIEAFRNAFPDPEVIYLDGFNLFAFFGHAQDRSWRLQDSRGGDRLQIWRVGGEDEGVIVLRDRRRWNGPLDDSAVHGDIRAALESVGESSATVLGLDQARLQLAPASQEETLAHYAAIVRAARSEGLEVRGIVGGGRSLFLELRPREPGMTGQGVLPERWSIEGAGIRADPDRIQLCSGEGTGATTLHWGFPGRRIDLRIGEPDGKLWITPPPAGSASTGDWVTDGMEFFVQNRDAADPTSPEATLGMVVVDHTDVGCPAEGTTSPSGP